MAKMDKDFENWLNQKKYGTYNGIEITPQTELVSYTYVISVIVMTFRHSTRYYFKEVEKGKALQAKILCVLCNLIFGWWGIPWGPIWVIKETFCNLADSNTKFWGEIAGKPQQNEEMQDNPVEKRQEIVQETPKKKKIDKKDLIIYILIGLVIGVGLIIADFMGYL